MLPFVYRSRRMFAGARFGHLCRVLWRGGRNSALVEWADGSRDVVSRNALRLTAEERARRAKEIST